MERILKRMCACVLVRTRVSPGGPSGKNPLANIGDVRDVGSIPGSGRSPGEGCGNPLQYSCLENPMDRGAWQTMVHRVAKSWTQLKLVSTYTHTQAITTKRTQI